MFSILSLKCRFHYTHVLEDDSCSSLGFNRLTAGCVVDADAGRGLLCKRKKKIECRLIELLKDSSSLVETSQLCRT